MALPPYPLPRETRESAVLTGSGVASYGPFTFKIFDENDVDVWRLDAGSSVWALQPVTVTKTGALAHDTFSILFPAVVANTTNFVVYGRRLHERQVALTRGGAIDSTMLEKELSKQGMILQEFRRDLGRTVRFAPGFEGSPHLPVMTPGKSIIVNEEGDGLTVGPDAADIAAAQNYAEAANESAAEALQWMENAEAAAAIAEGAKPYATRTAVKALTPAAGTAIILTEGVPAVNGRIGTFVFNAGDLSTQVAADTREGIYVAPDSDPTGASGAWVRQFSGYTNVHWWGVPAAFTDSQPAFAAANAFGHPCMVPPGRYRLDSGIPISSGMKFIGVRGGNVVDFDRTTVLVQYGQQAFIGDEDLEDAVISGFAFDLQASVKTAYTTALSLKAHRDCIFENLYFVRYNAATIIERIPKTATINTIDNVYRNWVNEASRHVAISIGQDGWAYTHDGNATTTVLNTGMVWPETFNSSVIVMKENSQRNFTELTLGTDYTVAYDVSSVLIVTLTAAALNFERIHIWPSQPRVDAATGKQRRPISNNRWEDIKSKYMFGHGFMDLRWVDYEIYHNCRVTLTVNSARAFYTNVGYVDRTGEAGDFNQYISCLVTYIEDTGLVTNPGSLWGWYFGPGSLQMYGAGAAADLVWIHSGVNRILQKVDASRIALAGTVAVTNGSPTVTGTGTVFRDKLTLIGGSVDTVEIAGSLYGIASIDSNTQITLSTNYSGSTASGLTMQRANSKNGASGLFDFASIGGSSIPASGNVRRGVGRVEWGSSTSFSTIVTIPATQTIVTVPHKLWRAPNRNGDMVSITPFANLDTGGTSRTAYTTLGAITNSSIGVYLSTAHPSVDLSVKLNVVLGELN